MELADFFFAGSVFDRSTPILRIHRRGESKCFTKKPSLFANLQFYIVLYFRIENKKMYIDVNIYNDLDLQL